MTRLIAALLTLSLLFTRLVIDAPRAAACTCESRETAAFVHDAALVVVGSVVDIDSGRSPGGYTFDFAVSEYLKGYGPDDVVIDQSGSSCDIIPEIGSEQLLFLQRGSNERLTTSICLGSTELTGFDAAFGAERLREVRSVLALQTPVPSPTPAGPAPTSDPPSEALDTAVLALIGVIAVVALSAGAVAVWRGTRA
jgi:hypothetical protein